MADRDRMLAAGLFVGIGLLLPASAALVPGAGKVAPSDVPFLVDSAFVELKFDAAAEVFPEFKEALPGLLSFSADSWVEVSRELVEEKDRTRLLKPLATACLALARDADARKLSAGGGFSLRPEDPFSFLAEAGLPPSPDRLRRDAQTGLLPGWLNRPLVAAWTGGKAPDQDRMKELLAAELRPFLAGLAAAGVFFSLLLVAGIVLLAFARAIIRRHAVPVWTYGSGRFDTPPLHVFALFMAWLSAFVLLHAVLVPMLSGELSDARIITIVYLAHAAAGVALVRYWGGLQGANLLKAVDLERPPKPARTLLFGLGGAAAALPVVVVLVQVGLLLFGGQDTVSPAVPVLVGADEPADRWLLAANVLLLAPLFEEFLFRGFLFQQFRRLYGVTNGVVLSALVFAAIHQSIELFLPLFGLGVILALLYHHAQSLWASVAAHGLYNSFTIVFVAVLYGWS